MATGTRGSSVLVLALAVVLGACNASESADTTVSAPETTASADTPDTTPPERSTTEPSETCREVEHPLGTSCIPVEPQRVVTLGGPTPLDYVLALGLPLVGYDGDPVEPHHPHYVDPEKLGNAEWVGSFGTPNLEQVAALEPDLIIYNYDNGDYPQVSQIAPTIILANAYTSYREDFQGAARMLGMEAQAEEVLTSFDDRIAEVRGGIAEKFGDQTISVFRTQSDGMARIYGTDSFISELLADLEINLPEAQQAPEQDIGLEQIGLLDGDVGFVTHGFAINDPEFTASAEETKEEYVNDPLWQTLAFVQNEQMYVMDRNVWGSHGILWASAMLDNIQEVALSN